MSSHAVPTFPQIIAMWVGGTLKTLSNPLQGREKDETDHEIQPPSLLLKTSQYSKFRDSVDKSLLPYVFPNSSAKSWKLQTPTPTVYSHGREILTLFSIGPFYAPKHSYPVSPWPFCGPERTHNQKRVPENPRGAEGSRVTSRLCDVMLPLRQPRVASALLADCYPKCWLIFSLLSRIPQQQHLQQQRDLCWNAQLKKFLTVRANN